MPGPALTQIETDHRLPDRVDVVVIGGGIIGVMTALELVERGVSVLVCDKGQIGAEQSSRNWGWVRLGQRDRREIPLMIAAIRAWQGMDARLGRKTGYVQGGILFSAATPAAMARNAGWLRLVEGCDVAARLASTAEIDALLPGHRLRLAGALYTPGDGRAEPQWAVPAMAEAARAAGAVVMAGCAVRSLDIEAGRVTGVITEQGRVRCGVAVLAGGAWSRLFAGNAGVKLPQLKVLNTVMRTTSVEGPETALWCDEVAFRKRADGGYTVASGYENTYDLTPDSLRLAPAFLPLLRAQWRSVRMGLSRRSLDDARQARSWASDDITPFELCRVLDPEPSSRALRQAWSSLRRVFPVFEGADVVQSWAGMIDVTPDEVPVISPVDAVPGFFIATGFSGHGFGIGPGAGRLMADLVTASDPVVDPGAFRLSRFSDGSRIVIDPRD